MKPREVQTGREEYWAKRIEAILSEPNGRALIRVGAAHVDQPNHLYKQLTNRIHRRDTGKLHRILRKNGIRIRVVHRIADVNRVFEKS